jgi:hypothetical protein
MFGMKLGCTLSSTAEIRTSPIFSTDGLESRKPKAA